jgi:dipeptidyl aminopeptidase/acylaminoacyl peptidase
MTAMMHASARVLLGALVLCCLSLPASAAETDEDVAREAALFGSLPHFIIPELSPDGAWIAVLEPVNGRKALVVRSRTNPDDVHVAFAQDRGRLSWFAWADSERLLVEASFTGWRGTPTVETRMYAVNRDGSDSVMLLTPGAQDRASQSGSMLMSFLPDDPNQVLMSWDSKSDGNYALYRVDIRTGRGQQVEPGSRRVVRWLADQAGKVRLRVDAVGVEKEIWVRDAAELPWRLLLRYDMLKGPFFEPSFFGPENPNLLYVRSERGTGRVAAYTVDVKTGVIGPALFSDPVVDVDSIIQARADGRAVGFLTTVDLPAIHYVDQTRSERQKAIDAKLPGTTNLVVSESKDDHYQLVAAIGSHEPGRFYVRDDASGALTLVGRHYPNLAPSEVGAVVPFAYQARDGLTIPAYITLPPGLALADARGAKRPLVIFPHGGPNVRTSEGFDFMAQFMASLGYIVLQPNFRGSTGYGHAFQSLGDRQWGKSMQDDLTDGAEKLVAEGIADPKRICIVGASFGGYAALMGAVRTPDLYACAASIDGIADLKRYVRDMRNYRFAEIRVPPVADPASTESIAGVSPVESAASIKAAVLLVHGDQDAIVPPVHSLSLAKALQRAHKTVELDVLKGGDHQLSEESVRIETLNRLGGFLRRYLGPAISASPASVLTSAPKA